jgi:cytosine/adenosine deaminase-related metal-dependent hydrolase
VYAGFGDGLSFAQWLAMHIERKARIDRPEMEAIARLGAAQCLASGITTVGDAAFTGASAHACSDPRSPGHRPTSRSSGVTRPRR